MPSTTCNRCHTISPLDVTCLAVRLFMRSKRESDDIHVLDEWYQRKCNGEWEHRWGFTITTCDNPGWWAKFDDLPLNQKATPELLNSLLDEHGADVTVEGQEVRVFARSLRICLSVAAKLIDIASRPETDR